MSLKRWITSIAALALVAAAILSGIAETGEAQYISNMTPDQVLALEQRLNALGYLSAEADQVYDQDTRLALQTFQQANGMDVTGQLDDATQAALDSPDALSRQEYLTRFAESYRQMTPMRNGDINKDVQALQAKLVEYGYFSGAADGIYGDGTQQAVERFQMVNGLAPTGVADGMTIMRLMADVPITWQLFLSEMSCGAGDSGLNVYVLQKKLQRMGYFEGDCTGSFGDLTQQAVALFQADNDLDETGVADAATWELIYSGTAVARRRADVIQMGDIGDSVTQVQQQLKLLGYYNYEVSGVYDYVTETAVRLFQMANDLPSTGDVDDDTLNRLLGDSALRLSDPAVQEGYAALMAGRGDTVQAVIGEIAMQMLGAPFAVQDDALYPGFALVQYACVAAGLPITTPEMLIQLATQPVEVSSEVQAGNIVALQSASGDSVVMLLAIGAGDGRIVYSHSGTDWVVMSYIDQMDSERVYRWAEAAQAVDAAAVP